MKSTRSSPGSNEPDITSAIEPIEYRSDRVDISVIIPARNEAATIERVIERLLTSSTRLRVEVIVADGRSSDGTRELLDRLAANDGRVRVVDNAERITPVGLNLAIAATSGDVIARMDAHAEPDPGYLEACLSVLRETGAWSVGGVMRKIGATRAARAGAAATSSSFGIGGGRRFHLQREPIDIDSVWLGCWPRWVFERIGLFDPELVRNQDDEFSQRILDAGGRIRFDPSISAAYVSRASWKSLVRQYFEYGAFKVRAFQKRPRLLRVRHLVPAGLVACIVASAILLIATPWAIVPLGVLTISWLFTAWWFARTIAAEFDATTLDTVRAYACIHAGYGAGTWAGLVRFAPRWFINRRGVVPKMAQSAE
jgi:glycosyltransferase involved in cell wall biosynthesis